MNRLTKNNTNRIAVICAILLTLFVAFLIIYRFVLTDYNIPLLSASRVEEYDPYHWRGYACYSYKKEPHLNSNYYYASEYDVNYIKGLAEHFDPSAMEDESKYRFNPEIVTIGDRYYVDRSYSENKELEYVTLYFYDSETKELHVFFVLYA